MQHIALHGLKHPTWTIDGWMGWQEKGFIDDVRDLKGKHLAVLGYHQRHRATGGSPGKAFKMSLRSIPSCLSAHVAGDGVCRIEANKVLGPLAMSPL